MDKPTATILRLLDLSLDHDLARLKIYSRLGDKPAQAARLRLKKHRDFVKYIVSVATHPIGLRASMSPFNIGQEDMLAYVMDMFALSDEKLKKILFSEISPLEGKSIASRSMAFDLRKRHPWRPEVRLRLGAPLFFYNEEKYMQNLHVRVYLFGETSAKEKSKIGDKVTNEYVDSKQQALRFLMRILRRHKVNPASLIRPVNEMRRLIRFKPKTSPFPTSASVIDVGAKRTVHQMTQLVSGTTRIIDEDIHIRIRRYYCDPDTVHTIRLEFWLSRELVPSGIAGKLQNCARRIMAKGSCFKTSISEYRTENHDFYGFINLRLSQLPSYASKQICPILSKHEKRINCCEVQWEPRNRRIIEDDEHVPQSEYEDTKPKKPVDAFIIAHVRLYMNCVLYQCLSLNILKHDVELLSEDSFQNTTLDNLFYLPAHSLINQHRLQSNLSRLDDLSLRRTSMILLLIKLDSESVMIGERVNIIMILLASIIQSEYTATYGSIDDKTMQELDPFKDELCSDSTKNLVDDLELAVLSDFVQKFLIIRLKTWLIKSVRKKVNHNNRLITTLALRLIREAIAYFRKRKTNSSDDRDGPKIKHLKSVIDTTLCEIMLLHINSRIERLLNSGAEQEIVERTKLQRPRRTKSKSDINSSQNRSGWLKLLRDIRYMNHDLSLHWFEGGLDEIVVTNQKFVQDLKSYAHLDESGLSRLIEAKMKGFLK